MVKGLVEKRSLSFLRKRPESSFKWFIPISAQFQAFHKRDQQRPDAILG